MGEVLVMLLVALVVGAAGFVVLLEREVRGLRSRLAAAVESSKDMGWLLARLRRGYETEMRRLDQTGRRSFMRATAAEADVEWLMQLVSQAMAERDEARGATLVVLAHYGRALERAEAADAAAAMRALGGLQPATGPIRMVSA